MIQGIELEQCVNSSLCLPRRPKLVVGLNGSTANIFVDNAAYREFQYTTFHVASVDMESAAVVMASSLTLHCTFFSILAVQPQPFNPEREKGQKERKKKGEAK